MSGSGDFQIEEATIEGIHAAMQKGMLTARQLVEKYLDRIEAFDKRGPSINSVIAVNPRAIEEAEALDAEFKKSGITGPLHGICILLKDNIQTKDMPMTGGSLSLKGYHPANDAPMVMKFREAGAIILAKVNLHEFALWGETVSSILGQTLNPYDPARTPGGSSGGTGAAIAANFGSVGIGTDTVNSIRSPASACSLVGIKPTIGLISRNGIIPYSHTQDSAGPITRSVADSAHLLDLMAGYDPDDPATISCIGHIPTAYTAFLAKDGLKDARIGVLESFFGSGRAHDEVNEVVRCAIEKMKNEGAIIISVQSGMDSGKILSEISVNLYELRHNLDRYLQSCDPPAPVQSLQDILTSGKYYRGNEANMLKALSLSMGDHEYSKRLERREQLQKTYLKIMDDNGLDAMVFPHQKRLVVPLGEQQAERNGVLTAVTGFPSIAVPAGFSKPTVSAPIGVPVGLEFVGRPWSEALLIKLAYAFEQATQFRRPPVLPKSPKS